MKIGDLVKYSMRKTRKGMPYEEIIGVVTHVEQMRLTTHLTIVKAVFDATEWTFSLSDLEVVSSLK